MSKWCSFILYLDWKSAKSRSSIQMQAFSSFLPLSLLSKTRCKSNDVFFFARHSYMIWVSDYCIHTERVLFQQSRQAEGCGQVNNFHAIWSEGRNCVSRVPTELLKIFVMASTFEYLFHSNLHFSFGNCFMRCGKSILSSSVLTYNCTSQDR